MSIPQTKEFVCPICKKVIRTPFTQEQILEHLKTHTDDKSALTRMMKSTGIIRAR